LYIIAIIYFILFPEIGVAVVFNSCPVLYISEAQGFVVNNFLWHHIYLSNICGT